MLIPPLEGTRDRVHDGRSRTWTVEHIPDFADLPAFEPGMRSPVLVALDNWHVNWFGGQDRELSVFRYAEDGGDRHPDLDHAHFNTVEEAHAAAWAAGLLGFYVYEDVAGLYGLPSTLGWARHTPDIDDTECGETTRRKSGARTATWSRLLNDRHDATTWTSHHGTLFAVVAVSTYNAVSNDDPAGRRPYIEIEYGCVLATDRDDPGGTAVWSNYDHDSLEDLDRRHTAGPDILDEVLNTNITASFHNFRAFDGMSDDVWNGLVSDQPDTVALWSQVENGVGR